MNKVWARKTFNYNGSELEQGEVFDLIGARNDEKLLRVGYLEEVKEEVSHCTCGKEFVEEINYLAHCRGSVHPKEPYKLSKVWSEDKPVVKKKRKNKNKRKVKV